MPRTAGTSTPTYRCHKPSGQAVVTIEGRDFYLGPYGTKRSQTEFDRLIGEWMANGRRLARTAGCDLTINELLVDYLRFAQGYYREGNELANIKCAVRQLMRLYGSTLTKDFGPLALKAVREAMIKDDLCRNEVNKRVRHVQRVFKWGVENERVAPTVLQAIKAVAGLRRGRSAARESEPVKPVPDAFVNAVKPHVSRQVWAMIELQRLTGMRPGEVVIMRGCDLGTSGTVWTYTPMRHKTAYHGHCRTIFLGPRAQEVLRPWLRTDLAAYLFNPAEAMIEWNAERRRRRETPLTPSQAKRRPKRRPKKASLDRYSVDSYRRAIKYAVAKENRLLANRRCEARNTDPTMTDDVPIVPAWHPHQLRHNAATWLRREFGLDVARIILGHRSTTVTEVYAEVDQQKAIAVMACVG